MNLLIQTSILMQILCNIYFNFTNLNRTFKFKLRPPTQKTC